MELNEAVNLLEQVKEKCDNSNLKTLFIVVMTANV